MKIKAVLEAQGFRPKIFGKGLRNSYNPWMVKIKTNSYMQRLQQTFEDNWKSYWE